MRPSPSATASVVSATGGKATPCFAQAASAISCVCVFSRATGTARAGNRRFLCLSAPRAHTKAPYKTDLYRETLRALNRPGGPGPSANVSRETLPPPAGATHYQRSLAGKANGSRQMSPQAKRSVGRGKPRRSNARARLCALVRAGGGWCAGHPAGSRSRRRSRPGRARPLPAPETAVLGC